MEQLHKNIQRSRFSSRGESSPTLDANIVGMPLQEAWRSRFPHFFTFCLGQGGYRIPDREWLLRALEGGFALTEKRNSSILRVDLAMAYLWPLVSEGRAASVFPSRLAAAVAILGAADGCKAASEELVQTLSEELIQAMEDAEQALKWEKDAEE